MERAKIHLQNLQQLHNRAYKERKEKWFEEHPDKQYFEDTYEEFVRNCKLEEWGWYFIERAYGMTNEQRYHAALKLGDTEKEAQEEKNKTVLDILNDYRKYPDFNKVLKVWTEQT